jgi:hypothetical protein
MFDIQSSKVHVLDPVHCPERAKLHDFFKTKFLQSLAGCFEAFYDNWYMSRLDDWQFHYPDLSVNNIARYELYLPFNITTTYIKTPLVCFYAPAPSYRSHMFFCIFVPGMIQAFACFTWLDITMELNLKPYVIR